ncbi:response regulator transcription factor [Hydrocarboniclastica marina]|uniref:DNA-binding response regulator n=1 Tax=Hydrocarboniclastica marina TaxID=2259620 RepID=A0A4P7XMS5_9ALTE|nr:response regulator transcription factor [Hydrocarboniclastica marina]QCF27487.1 DNA-binding response regulator [Hydrocarboniclastica marina]
MTAPKPAVAVIEDSEDLREELIFFLERNGYAAWGAGSAEHFWKQLHADRADIVLVDIGLPGEDGLGVIEHLRTLDRFGLIVISARGAQEDRAEGLRLGADQYLVKPLSFPHLLSSIEALWYQLERRGSQASSPPQAAGSPSKWALDHIGCQLISPAGKSLRLSQQEFSLVSILLNAPDVVMSKEVLAEEMYRFATEASGHRIDVIMSRLRKKARDKRLRLPINAIFGKGLVFVSGSG